MTDSLVMMNLCLSENMEGGGGVLYYMTAYSLRHTGSALTYSMEQSASRGFQLLTRHSSHGLLLTPWSRVLLEVFS